MTGLTEVCGLRVAGRLSPLGRTAHGVAELVMEPGTVSYPGEGGPSDGLEANGRGITLRASGGVLFCRFHGVAEVALDMNGAAATIDLSSSAAPGMDEILAGGPVLALALALRGRPCLHGSAVSIGGKAVAFTAPSGGGKSALAALACLAGAELVADDTLALAVKGTHPRCLPGGRELRLRPPTAELVAGADWARRTTADGRVAVLAGREQLAPPRLAAIVLPVVTAHGVTAIERLGGAPATRALLGCARVISLRTPEHAKTMLSLAATLGASVPVYRVTMPVLRRPVLPEPILWVLKEHCGGPL